MGRRPPGAPMVSARHLHVLRRVCELLEGTDVTWVLTGSLGLALRGVDTEVHDIDVQTDAAGALELERLLAEHVVRPVELKEDALVRSYLGAAEIDGVEVEIIGDIQKRAPGGPWGHPPDLAGLAVVVDAGGVWVPVLPLEYESDAYRAMGRSEKADLIDAALRA